MQFGILGINHKKAGLSIRDRTSFTDSRKLEFFQKAAQTGVDQCMVLSTCNRSEVCFFYSQEQEYQRIQEIYQELFADINLGEYLVKLSGTEALSYLFRITAGLESLVQGEDQILGQVKEALDYSRTMGYCGKELNKVVRDAVTCAKKIQTELKISQKPLSVSYVAVKELEKVCGVSGKQVLIIGSGNTAVLALKYISELQAAEITVCSRNYTHTKKLLEQFPQISIISYELRYDAMKNSDIVISATASPHLVVRSNAFFPVHPVVFLDLAAPRDIDPAFKNNPLVRFIDLDTLQEIIRDNRKQRKELAFQSRKLIEEKLRETTDWLLQSRMDDTIASLQLRCQVIVSDSFEYLNRKLSPSPREQKLIKKVLHASLQRLLREPVKELKRLHTQDEQEQFRQLVRQLFQIEDRQPVVKEAAPEAGDNRSLP